MKATQVRQLTQEWTGHGVGTHISYLATKFAVYLSPHLQNKMIWNHEMDSEVGCWVSALGPRVSGSYPGKRIHKTFDLASISHNAPCCPWCLNEQDSPDLLSAGLALWAAFQHWVGIYAESSTLAFPDASSPSFYCRIEQICQSQWELICSL